MQSLTPKLPKELADQFDAKNIAKSEPLLVNTFPELVAHTARIAYYNKDQLIFYRGQANDYRNRNNSSTFLPSIYRGDYLSKDELDLRFNNLEEACKQIVSLFQTEKIIGHTELRRKKLIQWSILQHYEVSTTPLLDFTQSLRVACSFAWLKNSNDHAFVFAFGMPYMTNRISSNSEEDIVNIRLLSITPPDALRPFYQEGYLAGTTDVTNDYDNKNELDFNNRLIMKFKIPIKQSFWGKDFNIIPENALYPDQDRILELCQLVKIGVENYLASTDIGDFLKEWNEVEALIIGKAGLTKRHYSIREGLKDMKAKGDLDEKLLWEVDRLRRFRNDLVHNVKSVNSGAVKDYMHLLRQVRQALQRIDRKK